MDSKYYFYTQIKVCIFFFFIFVTILSLFIKIQTKLCYKCVKICICILHYTRLAGFVLFFFYDFLDHKNLCDFGVGVLQEHVCMCVYMCTQRCLYIYPYLNDLLLLIVLQKPNLSNILTYTEHICTTLIATPPRNSTTSSWQEKIDDGVKLALYIYLRATVKIAFVSQRSKNLISFSLPYFFCSSFATSSLLSYEHTKIFHQVHNTVSIQCRHIYTLYTCMLSRTLEGICDMTF